MIAHEILPSGQWRELSSLETAAVLRRVYGWPASDRAVDAYEASLCRQVGIGKRSLTGHAMAMLGALLISLSSVARADVCAYTAHHSSDSCGVVVAGVVWIPEQKLTRDFMLYEGESEESSEYSVCMQLASGSVLCMMEAP